MPERYRDKTLSVIGLGYIGLPTAAVFASRRIKVIGVDIDPRVVDTINKGEIHIVEPELDMVVHAAVTGGYLRATTTPEPADAFLIAVPTPFVHNPSPVGRGAGGEGKPIPKPDLRYIEAAAKAIAPLLKKGDLVILESTSPVGATEQMAAWMAECRPGLSFPQTAGEDSDIRIAHGPERVLPGHVIRELVENDRVIGGMTPKCAEAACALYRIFVEGECVVTDVRTAEMCKLTENAFRDVNIAFANELSIICDKLDINVWELIRLANRHPRVNILQPGPGVGGHCIAVDPWFIVDKTPDQARLIRAAREVNDGKPEWVVEKIMQSIARFVQSGREESTVRVALLGLSFKPNIDDLRESPALRIARDLSSRTRAKLLAVEPNIDNLPVMPGGMSLCTLDQALNLADVIVILVAHREFEVSKSRFSNRAHIINTVGICDAR